MWYIHVSVKVNTEDRLRDHTAPFLQRNAPSYLPSPSVACASFPEEHCDLTDHLVLRYLDNEILGRLVDTMPLFKHADAYAGIPEDVPERFREGRRQGPNR
ncbi:hypothetical protein SLS53_006387 [Cytospora paraplurivora]|uniref:Uncharacterized protein n=1 Tax=Cytospora paraplurivora TaxID=2898453 RepID=A0AAN9U5A8_9PEZI